MKPTLPKDSSMYVIVTTIACPDYKRPSVDTIINFVDDEDAKNKLIAKYWQKILCDYNIPVRSTMTSPTPKGMQKLAEVMYDCAYMDIAPIAFIVRKLSPG